MKHFGGFMLMLAGCLAGGCTAPAPKLVVNDPDPSVKIPAIKNAVNDNDLPAAKQMVYDLGSDDAAVRFYAIEGLFRLTGERFGYEYYAPEHQRQAAIDRWQAWLTEHNQ
jgi:hypothetical protein